MSERDKKTSGGKKTDGPKKTDGKKRPTSGGRSDNKKPSRTSGERGKSVEKSGENRNQVTDQKDLISHLKKVYQNNVLKNLKAIPCQVLVMRCG